MKKLQTDLQLPLLCGLLAFLACPFAFADTQKPESLARAGALSAASPANIIQYVRDRFEVPRNVQVQAEPVHASQFPHFYQTAVTVNDGKQKRTSNVFLTDDARCFVVGNIIAINGGGNAEIEHCVSEAAKLPATALVTVAPLATSVFPDFLQSTVTVRDGAQTKSGELYVTLDRRTAILGMVLPFRADFVERLIDTKDQPSIGPSNARVTIVEYADLECPTCAYFQKFLETEFLPRYGSKVRIVFKEFPLSGHPWSMTAAAANECAEQIDPAKSVNYRTLIFASQESISAATARDQLLSLGAQVGLDRLRLSSCLDAQTSRDRINTCLREVQVLGVSRTPTFFVNGRIVVGVPAAQDFYAMVDQALAAPNAKN